MILNFIAQVTKCHVKLTTRHYVVINSDYGTTIHVTTDDPVIDGALIDAIDSEEPLLLWCEIKADSQGTNTVKVFKTASPSTLISLLIPSRINNLLSDYENHDISPD